MKTGLTVTVLTALLIGSAALAEKEAKLKAQTVCPVMGGKINKNSFLDHEGQRIYVCCPGCLPALKKNPAKYIKKMAEKGEKPAQLQTKCPVMGGKINKDVYVDHDGYRVYLCCPGCDLALKKDPGKYIEKMKKDGIVLERTPKKDKK